MGKSKTKKFKTAKPKPTGLPSVKDFEAELEEENSNTVASNATVQNLIDKLTSPNEEQRECGCTGIAGLVSQPQAISCLLQANAVKILAPLILDHSLQVRHRALGALRNLSVDGGLEVCEEMVRRDVLTPLVAFFRKYGVDWVPEKTGKKQADFITEAFTEGTHLLWNLCEASETAVEVFNKENLVEILWPCLQYRVYGVTLAVTVGQCLHTVSEDNAVMAAACGQGIDLLQSLIGEAPDSSSHVLLKTLATGILVNISSGRLTSAPGDLVVSILSSVSDVLAVDALQVFLSTYNGINESGAEGDVHKETKVDIKDKLGDVKNYIAAQMVALEIVANLCCSDEAWEDPNSSESSSDDMAAEDIEEEVMEDNFFSPLCIPSEVQGAILSNGIFSKVLRKAQPCVLPEGGTELTDTQKTIVKSFEKLETHALLCVNNLVSSLELEALGGLDNLHSVWQGLVQLTATKQTVEKSGILEAVTSAMRAVVQKLAEQESPKLLEVTAQDLKFLYEMGQKCQCTEVRVNAVRIVATIGGHFAKNKEPHPMLQNLGLFLLEMSCRDTELWVVAESLDSIFDVFGEDHVNSVITEIRLIERLKQLLPTLKSKMKCSRQSLGEHYPVISTAKTNLIRFIKYKSSL